MQMWLMIISALLALALGSWYGLVIKHKRRSDEQ
jgi:hypothetical protein